MLQSREPRRYSGQSWLNRCFRLWPPCGIKSCTELSPSTLMEAYFPKQLYAILHLLGHPGSGVGQLGSLRPLLPVASPRAETGMSSRYTISPRPFSASLMSF